MAVKIHEQLAVFSSGSSHMQCAGAARALVIVAVLAAPMSGCASDASLRSDTGVLFVGNTPRGTGAVDPDGFVVTFDGQAQIPNLAVNQTLAYTLAPGTYSVGLSGLASNCVVDLADGATTGPNPQNATVVAGDTSLVSFAVRCD
jgi:hypothetical protein